MTADNRIISSALAAGERAADTQGMKILDLEKRTAATIAMAAVAAMIPHLLAVIEATEPDGLAIEPDWDLKQAILKNVKEALL